MTKTTVALLVPGYQSAVNDRELIDLIPDGGIDKQDLAQDLSMSVRKLNYRLRREQNNWNIIKQNDMVYRTDDFLKDIRIDLDPKQRILTILAKYPYCTVDQLEFFTGLDRNDLARPIASLAKQDRIDRGLTRAESPDELFCLPDTITSDAYEEFPVFVLEKRDALVEMIKLERYFTHKNADYWIFIDGIPQAEFDLDKTDGRNEYLVKNLSRFPTTNHELPNILSEIENWSKDRKIRVLTNQVDDELTAVIKDLLNLLHDRGYQVKKNRLVLDRQQQNTEPHPNAENDEPSSILNWKVLGSWAKNRQFLDYDGTAAELLYHLGPLEDIRSIAYRLSRDPNVVDLTDVVYIPGINYRMAFVHVDHVEDIIRGWPKQVKFSFLDKKIMSCLQNPSTTDEIMQEVSESPITVKQRLRYLERARVIRKQLPGDLHFDHCSWILFDTDLPAYNKPIAGKRAMASVGTFMLLALESNPPLTKEQLSRYLGISIKELQSLLDAYLRRHKIIEGYFLADMTELQYTTAEVIDTIHPSEDDVEDLAAVNRVDLLPLSDPYAILHLPPLVLEDPTIQPKTQLPEQAEQWMICWDGQPVGYFIKQPTLQPLLDYELDLKITSSMVTTPIIAGALQKLVALFRTWYADEGLINSINGIKASDDHWKNIHFLIESIGIEMN